MTVSLHPARAFSHSTRALGEGADAGIALALAPARTPHGLDPHPSFFSGFATQPLVLSRGLLALSDITATRYFQYTPESMRDPVLTAHGDRLRAETFSVCNGVYARLDLLGPGFDGGEIGWGATNVDLGQGSRAILSGVKGAELLHLDVGERGLTIATPDAQELERPVQMPDRWIRALGNVAELHRRLTPRITMNAGEARAFMAAVPPATAAGRTVWLVAERGRVWISTRSVPGAVSVPGLHRLSAAKRLLPHLTGLTVSAPEPGSPDTGATAIEIALPHARFVLGLTAEPWRGHSGEGALLTAMAGEDVLADAELIAALLAFEPRLEVARLRRDSGLSESRVDGAIAVLAASGRVGWDIAEGAHFHRELPADPDRVVRDHSRLSRARTLVAAGRVQSRPTTDSSNAGAAASAGGTEWVLRGTTPGADSVVRRVASDYTCTCTWFLRHGTGRGPCAHILSVRIHTEEIS